MSAFATQGGHNDCDEQTAATTFQNISDANT